MTEPARLSVRLARPEDKAALDALQYRASIANAGDRQVLLAHRELFDLPLEQITRAQVIIAESEGVIAGFAVILRREDGGAELDGLFVDPPCWRQGIGTHLVGAATAHARMAGARALHVTGNPHALAFYYATGFELTGQTQTQFGNGPTLRLQL